MNRFPETLLQKTREFINRFAATRAALNLYMRKRYTANLLAGFATGICCLLVAIMLFVPSYIGMGNDSIANASMHKYGLAYPDDGTADGVATNAYFTRIYALRHPEESAGFSLESVLVHFAMALDHICTSDQLFDIRFLAALYTLLYLPGVYLVIKAALERVHSFSEAIVLTFLGVLIFSDISYTAYFNSLYPDALLFILLLYMAGSALLLHRETRFQPLYMLLLGLSGSAFCLAARRGFLAGIVLAFFLLMYIRRLGSNAGRALNVALSCTLLVSAVFSLFQSAGEFDQTGKFHAMTRGVLLQSSNPAKTLEDMGINPSFSVLADASLYDYYPVTELNNPLIQRDFLDRYTQKDLILYYAAHPAALFGMWDLGVKASVNLRRDYCGNFERATGAPIMSKSLYCAAWSIFKNQSAPKTIGYLLVILIVLFCVSGRKLLERHRETERWNYTFFMANICLLLLGIADLTYIILHSGDAQLVQFNIVLGTVMDIVLYFIVAELLSKLNILEEKSDAK